MNIDCPFGSSFDYDAYMKRREGGVTMKYSEISSEDRKRQVDIALRMYLEFLKHYEAENDQPLAKFEDFFLNDDCQPHLERVARMGEFGLMVHISRVSPYWDEGGPSELIVFFSREWDELRTVTDNIDLMIHNFDTLSEVIYQALPWPKRGYGFRWEWEGVNIDA